MIIHKRSVGPLGVCCYIVTDSASTEAIVIDPGAGEETLTAFIMEKQLIARWIVLTHGHGDHIGANTTLKKKFPGVQICIHEEDQDMLTSPTKNLSILAAFYGGSTVRSPPADRILKDGDMVSIKGCDLEVIHTPGHSSGGICLFIKTREGELPPVLFSGDTLFKDGIGRTDFPGCSQERLVQSIRERLLGLDEKTVVYPGHGLSTTIAEEKRNNPFLR